MSELHVSGKSWEAAHPSTSLRMSRTDGLDAKAHPERSRRVSRAKDALLIEGYASLFGVADAAGDVVRAGAFARSLREMRTLPMLLQHRSGAVAGRWTRMIEDGRGLYVRGLVEAEGAQAMARQGLNGLSIGFRPRLWRVRRAGGRELVEVDLVEVSLVAAPMLARARFALLGGERKAA
mgnify:FL=1